MGIAAYNRGSQVIAKQINRDYPKKNVAFEIMDRINALPKFKHGTLSREILDSKIVPFSDKVTIFYDKQQNVWWILDPVKLFDGFGYFYKSLEDLIRSWDIYLTGYDETLNHWYAEAIN